jgi:hypothetical protein
VEFERLLAEHTQDILPIIQRDYSLQLRNLTLNEPFRSLRV